MFDFPNSSAMDATAITGGPGTLLCRIVTGQPARIARHSAGLLAKATEFLCVLDQFTKAAQQLRTVWSGQASDTVMRQIAGSLQAFERIINVVQTGAALLGVSGTLVESAQTAYRGVVGSVNPAVAALMANPWTYGAAVALSTSTSAALREFLVTTEESLRALGVVELDQQIAALACIAGDIEQQAKMVR